MTNEDGLLKYAEAKKKKKSLEKKLPMISLDPL